MPFNNTKYSSFQSYRSEHGYLTSGKHIFNYKIHKTGMFENVTDYRCIELYNKISCNLRQLENLKTFNKRLATFLLQNCFIHLGNLYGELVNNL